MVDFKTLFSAIPVPLSKESIEAIASIVKIEEIPKGKILIKEGQIAHRLYFLAKGTARTFYFYNGKDITSWIYQEHTPITTWYSFLDNKPSIEHLEILEDAQVVSLLKEDLEKLYCKYPNLEQFGRKMAEQQLAFLDNFYKGYLFMSAREKYDLLLSVFPDVTQRVNLGHIASLLGISQETLSRIRAKS